MALKKDITLDNGIVLNYHRIVSINNITNQGALIEVASYVNEEQRNKEKAWYEEKKQGDMNIFINTKVYPKEYNGESNIVDAYEYLKTLEEFKDSENA